jgi:hypothetical protein
MVDMNQYVRVRQPRNESEVEAKPEVVRVSTSHPNFESLHFSTVRWIKAAFFPAFLTWEPYAHPLPSCVLPST